MRIVFLVCKINFYRFFYPLVSEALRRGHDVECWHDYHSLSSVGVGAYGFPFVEKIPKFDALKQPKVKIFQGDAELSKLLVQNDIDVVFSLNLMSSRLSKETIEAITCQWVTIMSTIDNFFSLPKIGIDPSVARRKEIFFIYAQDWLDKGRDYLNRFFPERSHFLGDAYLRYMAMGNPEFDTFALVDTERVREKYGVPADKKIFLYLPFPYVNRSKSSAWEMAFCGILTNTAQTVNGQYIHNKRINFFQNVLQKIRYFYQILKDSLALRYLARGINEARVFKSVREFCDNNGLFLVVKPRLKFPVAEFIKKKADLIVWDTEEQQNPPVLKELLSIAEISSSYFSMSVLTSAFSGTYHLTLVMPEIFFIDESHKFWFSEEKPSIFNFPGVCRAEFIEEAIRVLKKANIEQFRIDAQQRKNYVRKYIGFDDFNSSKRIFDILEKECPAIKN